MATSTAVGRGVRLEIGITEGTPLSVDSITKADPPVATVTGTAPAAKSIGYLTNVGGMVQLEGQAVRVASVTGQALTLEDLDTTTYSDYTADSADLTMVTEWATIGRATSWSKGGGAAQPLDDTVLLDVVTQEVAGQLPAETINVGVNMQTLSDAGLTQIRKAARTQAYKAFRLVFPDGNIRAWRGQPSLPGEDLQRGAIGTGTFSINVKGQVLEGAA